MEVHVWESSSHEKTKKNANESGAGISSQGDFEAKCDTLSENFHLLSFQLNMESFVT